MQGELRFAIVALLGDVTANTSGSNGFEIPVEIPPSYAVKYRQISNEIYVGGVYIRLFLKQPTFKLTNAVLFLEKLVEFWESSFSVQVSAKSTSENASDSRSVVLGNEDFISLLTSCIICVVKGEPTVVEHLLSWGFVHGVCKLLKKALIANRRGSPMIGIIRLLHQLVQKVEVVDSLAVAEVDIIDQLSKCLKQDDGKLPKESAAIVELLKKIYQCRFTRYLSLFVSLAINANLPNFLLDGVLGASPDALSDVRNPSALRIHTVDLLKAIAAADESTSTQLQALLDIHPSWQEYRDQNHDLFITVSGNRRILSHSFILLSSVSIHRIKRKRMCSSYKTP